MAEQNPIQPVDSLDELRDAEAQLIAAGIGPFHSFTPDRIRAWHLLFPALPATESGESASDNCLFCLLAAITFPADRLKNFFDAPEGEFLKAARAEIGAKITGPRLELAACVVAKFNAALGGEEMDSEREKRHTEASECLRQANQQLHELQRKDEEDEGRRFYPGGPSA